MEFGDLNYASLRYIMYECGNKRAHVSCFRHRTAAKGATSLSL